MSNTPQSREAVEAALQGAIDAVDSLFATRETHSGHIHVALMGGHEAVIAKALLPILSATHLGRLIKTYGRELIRDYR